MARGEEGIMKVLDKYLSQHFIVILLGSNLVTVSLFLLISVFDSLGGLMVKKELPLLKIVQFFSYQIPQISYYAAPLSVLFGLLLTLGVLGQRSELTIMRVSGLSWLQIARWPIIITCVYAWLIYLVGGYLIPLANQQSKAFEKLEIEKETRLPGTDLWVFDSKDPARQQAVYIYLYMPKTKKQPLDQAIGVSSFTLDANFSPVRELRAERAFYLGDYDWALFDATIYQYHASEAPGVERRSQMVTQLPVKPKNFISLQKWPMELSLPELQTYIRNFRKSGFDPREYQVELASRYSIPIACLISFALGLGITVRMRRPQGIYLNTAWSLLFTFCYFALTAICLSLGKSGTLPAALSAWVGNIVFGLVAAYLVIGHEQD
jgi:lipopolysaccharide export system permease protein